MKEHMEKWLAMKEHSEKHMVKIEDLKKGDRFYSWNGKVLELLMYETKPDDPDYLRYAVRVWKTDKIETTTFNGVGVRERLFYPYKGRQLNSFYAGFKFAMNLCMKFMTAEEKQKAGIFGFGNEHTAMLKAYDAWKHNITEFYDPQTINIQVDKRKRRQTQKMLKNLLVP